MKIRYEDVEDFEELENEGGFQKNKKKRPKVDAEDRKDQKRYKNNHRIVKDKFFKDEDE